MGNKEPGCDTCVRQATCPRAMENGFCPMWQIREPDPKKPDPNEQWRKGDDFDG